MTARSRLRGLLQSRDGLLGALTAALLAWLAFRYPLFRQGENLSGILDDTAILILMALGQMLVMLTRGIDLSVASNAALCGMAVALLNHSAPQVPVPWLMLLSAALGLALGLCNGLLVWLLEIPPIVTTLGTLAIYRGAVYVLSGGSWVTSDKMTAAFQSLLRGRTLGLSTLSWLTLAVVVVVQLWLRYQPLGRRLYMVGGNPVAAAYLGLSAGRLQCLAFALSGTLAGFCGYLWVSHYAVAYTDVAWGFELQVIAACVIGGVSVAGGSGTVIGVLAGCLFLGLLKNALPQLGVSPFWQMAVSGLIITVAVVVNARQVRGGGQQILESSSP